MKLSFRWYGPEDPVTLPFIRQIPGVTGIVSACFDIPVGEAWPKKAIAALKADIEAVGLRFEVVESISLHEDIKLGRPSRDRYIDAYCQSVEQVGALGIPVVCYNFMPVFDWTRTNLAMVSTDGSNCLSYDHEELTNFDLTQGTGMLPGWAIQYSAEELRALFAAYARVEVEELWDNLAYFLERVVPVAASAGVKLAIHPDDPPWSVFGLPRIITTGEALARVCALVDHPANGVTLCTGSLGAHPENDLPAIVRGLDERIHFVHLRNVRRTGQKQFHESTHPFGDVDLLAVMQALQEVGFEGPVRPDHGRMIWGETGRPGYGLYDRALGATYLLGLWTALERTAASTSAAASTSYQS